MSEQAYNCFSNLDTMYFASLRKELNIYTYFEKQVFLVIITSILKCFRFSARDVLIFLNSILPDFGQEILTNKTGLLINNTEEFQ